MLYRKVYKLSPLNVATLDSKTMILLMAAILFLSWEVQKATALFFITKLIALQRAHKLHYRLANCPGP